MFLFTSMSWQFRFHLPPVAFNLVLRIHVASFFRVITSNGGVFSSYSSSCSATRRSVDLAFVAFESILHVLTWSDRCLLCLASRNRRAPALPNHWLLLVI